VAYKGYAHEFSQAADRFRAMQFPARMKPAADSLESALDALASDSSAVAKAAAKKQNEANVVAQAHLTLKLLDEEKTENKASDDLRKELGLPPAPKPGSSQPQKNVLKPTNG
jgi:hypothetical protein